MKLPADPESRSALTETEISAAVSVTIGVSGFICLMVGKMALTRERGGRMGHVERICPGDPQYKHRFWVSHLCRSVLVRWLESSNMGSWAGSGGLTGSGRQREMLC